MHTLWFFSFEPELFWIDDNRLGIQQKYAITDLYQSHRTHAGIARLTSRGELLHCT
ncbi:MULTISPECIES: hypothetical protein [Afipia]|uniref:hypothetical protein n=1 Tax=Afipia TaxID=1033 RepID=UPI00030955EC|nr:MULTISPECIES: hypothetical protein [Afipia]